MPTAQPLCGVVTYSISMTERTDRDRSEPPAVEPDPMVAPIPLLALGAFVAGLVIDRVVHVGTLPGRWNRRLGAVSTVAGVGLLLAAVRRMRRAGTTPDPADEPPSLVTGGVYRLSRNPIYVGLTMAYVGVALLFDRLWPLVTLQPVLLYLRRVVRREEAYLEARFGTVFDQYRSSVRRWL